MLKGVYLFAFVNHTELNMCTVLSFKYRKQLKPLLIDVNHFVGTGVLTLFLVSR
jgi:hypothetical protein